MSSKNGTKQTASQIRAEAKAKREAAEELEKANKALADAHAAEPVEEEGDENLDPIIDVIEPTKLEKIVAECGGQGSFIISTVAGNGQDSKIGQYDIDAWPDALEAVAVQKGGGTFKIVFRNEKGHYVNQTTRTFDADTYGALQSKNKVVEVGTGNDNAAMLAMFQTMQTQMMQMQLDSSKRSETLMLEMMKVQSQGASGGLPLKDLISLAQGSNNNKSGMAEIRELLETMRFLRDDGGLEPENPWVIALTRGMTMLKPFLEAGVNRLANPEGAPANPGTASPVVAGLTGSQLPVVASPGTTSPAPSEPPKVVAPVSALPPAPIPEDVQASTYGMYGKMLFDAATAGTEPGSAARFCLDNVQMIIEADNLKLIATDPHVVDRVISYNPAVGEHRAWLVDFFAEVSDGVESLIAELKGEAPGVKIQPVPAPVAAAPVPEPVVEVVPHEPEREPVA